jgi:hypothetical protein
MPHREFFDSRRVHWDVWEVVPEAAERRLGDDRRHIPRESLDRRRDHQPRYRVGAQMVDGWLCFECDTEKRRLAPIPDSWVALGDGELEQLCGCAVRAPRKTPRLAD